MSESTGKVFAAARGNFSVINPRQKPEHADIYPQENPDFPPEI